MLATRATPKTMLGPTLWNPSERLRAVAQTASRRPETARTIQDMVCSLVAVFSRTGYGNPRPGTLRVLLRSSHTPDRRGRLSRGGVGHPLVDCAHDADAAGEPGAGRLASVV